MRLILDGADNQPFDPTADLRVCLAYQNVAFALRATAMLERVGQAADVTGRMICSLWNFADLTESRWSQAAVADAVKADLLVIAAQEGTALPPGVRDWISRWLLTRQDLPHALVANVQGDPQQDPARAVVLPYLARVAEYGRMRFFGSSTEGDPPAHLTLNLAIESAQSIRANPTISSHLPPAAQATIGMVASICASAAPAPVGASQLAG